MTGAGEYGRALFLLCEEEKSTERVLDELDALSELLKQNPTYTKLLDTPAVVKDERLALMEAQFGDLPNVSVGFSRGLLADFCRENGVDVILKGVRNKVDEAYEIDMAEKNYARYSGAVTVLLNAPSELLNVSSTAVRELLASGGEITHLLGDRVAQLAGALYRSKSTDK
jgi:phosphopantetheine adenylyltransferase